MELTARKKQILKIVVESYIDTAEPLGSKAIAERMPEKVSSATVRNELSELSDMGYLEQPHTSAGRIPSPLGYRLYVNELMEHKPISAEEAAQINDTLRQELKGTDQVIAKTGQMVSSFVDYPTYAVADHTADATVRHFMVDSKEQLPVPADGRAMQILIGPENVNDALKESSVVVASYDIGDGMRGLVGVVGPTRMDYATVAARLSYFAESLTRMFGKHELPPKENEIQ
mgnify:CR=1 FL=1